MRQKSLLLRLLHVAVVLGMVAFPVQPLIASTEATYVSAHGLHSMLEAGVPDLSPTALAGPASAVVGQQVEVSWVVQNQGSGDARPYWYDNLYLSSDNIWDGQDQLLGQFSRNLSVAAGASYGQLQAINIPPQATAGNYYLILRTDGNNNLTESNETNNTRAVAISLTTPDLNPMALAGPASAVVGQQVEVSWVVQNQGSGDARPYWYDNLYLSSDNIWDGQDQLLGQFSRNLSVAAGASYGQLQAINIPPQATAGNYYLILRTDGNNNLTESNETNNTRTVAITLGASQLTPSSVAAMGGNEQVVVSWAPVAGAGSYNIYYGTNTGVTKASGTKIGNITSPYTHTSLTNGIPYYYVVTAVSSGVESVESRQVSAMPTAGAATTPDLTPTGLSAPASATTAQQVEVGWTVLNQGTGDTTSAWYDNVYLSTDAVWDGSDTSLGYLYRSTVLPVSISYVVTTTVAIPNVPAGSYYLLVRADSNNYLFESNEANNVRATPIAITTPDLTPTSLTGPASATTAQQLEVGWTVLNQGTGNAQPSWADYLYLSADAVWDGSDTYLVSLSRSFLLSPNASYAVTTTVTMPNVPAGSYYLLARIDSNNYLFESNEANNVRATPITIATPDLTPTGLSAPASATTAQQVEVGWTVLNQGAGTAQPVWYDNLYLSTDAVWDTSDTNLVSAYRPFVLGSGTSYAVTTTVAIPNVPAGSYYLLARADSNNYLFESNEANNVRATPITITTPDLTPTGLSAPASATTAQQVEVGWTVLNQGAGTAQPVWYDNLYLSTDAVWDTSDTNLVSAYRPFVLGSGTSYAVTTTVAIPNVPAGSYYLLARADTNNYLFESNEANNVRATPITITTPDLKPITLTAPTTAAPQQQIEVSWVAKNQGSGNTQITWTDNLYLSTDSTWDSQDIGLGYYSQNETVVAGTSYSQTQRITLPDIQPGNYYLILKIDGWGYLYESNEANNEIQRSIQIRIADAVNIPWRTLDSAQTSALGSLDFSPDGLRLVAAGSNRAFTWDLQTFTLRTPFTGHSAQIDTIDFSPVSDQVLSGARDGTARTWDVATREQIRSFAATPGQPNPAAFSGDGSLILTGSGLNLPRLWDAVTGTELRTLSGHTGAVNAVALSSDGTIALTGSSDKTAILWNTATGARLFTLAAHTDIVNSVALSPDGLQALSASNDGTIRLWDVASGALKTTFIQGNPVLGVAFSPDGKYIVSCGGWWPGRAYLWDVTSGALIRSFAQTEGNPTQISGVAMSPDRTLIATSHSDGQVRLWQSGLQAVPLHPVTLLTLGTPMSVTLQSHGLYYFEVDTAAGQNLLITLSPPLNQSTTITNDIGSNNKPGPRFGNLPDNTAKALANNPPVDPTAVRVVAKKDSLPSAYEYEYFAQSSLSNLHAEIPIAPTQAGKYYVLVFAPYLSSGSINASIRAEYVGFHISSIWPNSAGNVGNLTAQIRGTGFTTDTLARLVGPSGTIIPGATPLLSDFSEMYVTFDLRGRAPGAYDIQLEKSGQGAVTLVDGLQISAGTGARLETRLIVPEAVRPQRFYVAQLEYANVGDADMAVPLLSVSSTPSVPMTLRQSSPYQVDPIYVVGISFDGPASILPPGARYHIPIYFQAATNSPDIKFNLEEISSDDTPIAWDAIGTSIRPSNISTELWSAIWSNFKQQIGSTRADFARVLRENAAYLSQHGEPTYDVGMLFSTLLSRASGGLSRTTLAWGMDAYAPARGIPLSFERIALDPLNQRFTVGPFGRDWSYNYEYLLTQPDSATVEVQGPAQTARIFTKRQDGSWQPAPGDFGVLKQLPAGSWQLQEKDGTVWQYNVTGQLAVIQDQNGNSVTLNYTAGRLTELRHSNGQSFMLEYNTQGRISRLTDQAGRITTYQYDTGAEHLVSVAAPGPITTTFAYMPVTSTPSDHALQSITYPNGTHQYYAYDARGRLSAQWLDNNAQRVDFSYDAFGTVSLKDAAGGTTALRLGDHGQPLEGVDPLGNLVQMQHDENRNPTSLIRPDGEAAQVKYDSRGNPVEVTDALGHVTSMGYTTDFSRLDWMRDARDSFTDLTYDGTGNLTSIIYPNSTTERFSYDSVGNLTGVTNRRGSNIAFGYNSLGQLTRKTYPDGRTIDYTYDAQGNLASATDSTTGAVVLSHDVRGYLTRIEYPGGRWFTFEYNNTGQRIRRTGQDGYILNYYYDPAGRLYRLTDGNGAEIVRYEYDAVGRLSRETKGNGTYTTYTYDAAGRLLHLVNFAPAGTVQSRFDYAYDANGRQTSMTTLAGTTTYAYDATGQLVRVTPPSGPSVNYQYDAVGNRLTVTDTQTSAVYTTNTMNQYTQVATTTFSYDADGNLISKSNVQGTFSYEYDPENRLIRVTTPSSGTWQYTYDALGNRTTVSHDGVATNYMYDPAGLTDIAAEYDSGGGLTARYIQGFGLVARVDATSQAAYYSFDATGHTRQLTGPSGAVVNTYDYDPFGNPLQTSETIPNLFRYVGRFGVTTEGNGLIFMRARYYDPRLGRFTTADPIGFSGGDSNLYSYVGNNPVNHIDPRGTVIPLVLGAVGAVIGGAINVGVAYITHGGSLTSGQFWGALTEGAVTGGIAGLTGGMSLGWQIGFGVAAGAVGSGLSYEIEIAQDGGEFSGQTLVNEMVGGGVSGGIGVILGKMLGDLLGLPSIAKGHWNAGGPGFVNTLLGQNKHSADLWSHGILGGLIDLFDRLVGQPLLKGLWRALVIRPIDPNDKVGPVGTGQSRAVLSKDTLLYTVNFENQQSATAPVQELVVLDYLNPNLDWTTLQLSEIAYSDRVVSVPAGSVSFSGQDFPPSSSIVGTTEGQMAIDILASLNPQTGRIEWRLRAIDTATGLPPEDPYAGFLPPENGTGRGQGHVSFLIKPRVDVSAGTRITNTASIVFDTNAPIMTNEVWNTFGYGYNLFLPIVRRSF